MPLRMPRGAMCVQRFDDSLNSAIHITYRISLRSSSMREPRDPLLKVVYLYIIAHRHSITFRVCKSTLGRFTNLESKMHRCVDLRPRRAHVCLHASTEQSRL